MPVAAGVLLAIGLAVLRPWRGPADLTSEEWIASLPAGQELETRLGEGWTAAPWSEPRSGSPAEPLPYPAGAVAFRIGARTVDLAAALRAGNLALATDLAAQLDGLFAGTGSLTGSVAVGALIHELEAEAEPDRVREALRLLEAPRGLEHVDAYHAGRWLESARLAARAGDRKLFERRRWARAARELEQRSGSAELRQIAGRLAGKQPAELDALAADLDAAIALLGNGDAELVSPPPSD
jgi:hypothetical protein